MTSIPPTFGLLGGRKQRKLEITEITKEIKKTSGPYEGVAMSHEVLKAAEDHRKAVEQAKLQLKEDKKMRRKLRRHPIQSNRAGVVKAEKHRVSRRIQSGKKQVLLAEVRGVTFQHDEKLAKKRIIELLNPDGEPDFNVNQGATQWLETTKVTIENKNRQLTELEKAQRRANIGTAGGAVALATIATKVVPGADSLAGRLKKAVGGVVGKLTSPFRRKAPEITVDIPAAGSKTLAEA
ncbi:MAG: hypothetical protein AB7P76_08650 [Candidatus Melainabacteria bacterium]